MWARRVAVATAVVVPAGLLVSTGGAASAENHWVPVTRQWTLVGHGYGHGHGLSQYGAEGAARQGKTWRQIVRFYYPRTRLATLGGRVRVLVSADQTSDVQVVPTGGLRVRDLGDGARWRLPANGAERWRLTPGRGGATVVQYLRGGAWHRWRTPDGRVKLKGDGQFGAMATVSLVLPDGSSREYRGLLRSVQPASGSTNRDTVNVLRMDDYVKGVVPYEMPTSWSQPALRSQSVAARTYAAWQRAQAPTRYYQICDTTACQVYGGTASERVSSNRAVDATARQVLMHDGAPAFTQFSASSGGWSSDGGQPYLRAQRDPYDDWSGNPVHDWRIRVSTEKLEAAHPEVGRLKNLRVVKRDGVGDFGGRVLAAVLVGTQGRARVSGDDLRWLFGLRSTYFKIRATPVIARARWLRRHDRPIGKARSAQRDAARGGAVQLFGRGRIYWKRKVGAYELRGPILREYLRAGGPDTALRYPRTGIQGAPRGGRKARFAAAWIYTRSGTGTHVVRGKILKRYHRAGGAAGWVGYPTRDVAAVPAGRRQWFQHAYLTHVASTGKVKITRR